MLSTIYIIIGLITFVAQLRNGVLTAILCGVFWLPIILGLAIFTTVTTLIATRSERG